MEKKWYPVYIIHWCPHNDFSECWLISNEKKIKGTNIILKQYHNNNLILLLITLCHRKVNSFAWYLASGFEIVFFMFLYLLQAFFNHYSQSERWNFHNRFLWRKSVVFIFEIPSECWVIPYLIPFFCIRFYGISYFLRYYFKIWG